MTPEETNKEKPAVGKKARPTNCAQCNKRIHRNGWYYHNNSYFCGKNCSKTFWTKALEEKAKKAEEAKTQAEAKAKEAAKPQEESKPKEETKPTEEAKPKDERAS